MNSQQLILLLKDIHKCRRNATAEEKKEHKIWLWCMENILLYNRNELSRDKRVKMEEMECFKEIRKQYTKEWIDFQKALKRAVRPTAVCKCSCCIEEAQEEPISEMVKLSELLANAPADDYKYIAEGKPITKATALLKYFPAFNLPPNTEYVCFHYAHKFREFMECEEIKTMKMFAGKNVISINEKEKEICFSG